MVSFKRILETLTETLKHVLDEHSQHERKSNNGDDHGQSSTSWHVFTANTDVTANSFYAVQLSAQVPLRRGSQPTIKASLGHSSHG
ncbi:unnamed protein product [Porites lobata]|uniref:Uncharacterized protein n=1 Tax=Porites lobata TaxID=104759 RepID=A0ABN8MTM7_9CNID|nr:unnamed protein product [Porites lobata]